MKLRIASIAFLIGSLSTGLAWLTVQPALITLMDALRTHADGDAAGAVLRRVQHLLPLWIGLDLVAGTLLIFGLLFWMVGRPLAQMQRSIEQLGRMELELPFERGTATGPLLSRVQSSLRRMAEALRSEQQLTRAQLGALERANAELTRTQTELVAAERLATVGRLAAGVAHEVGNPLSGMLGYVSVLQKRLQDRPDAAEFLQRIEHEIQRIDQIVRSLLDLGRPARAQLGPVQLHKLVDGCVSLLGAGPDFRGVAVRRELSPELVARGESGALSQILVNLLINAAQAMEGKGTVLVRGRVEAGQVLLEVEDSGPGVPAHVLPHLFEPFFTTKAPGKGTGLGLAVSRHLSHTLGGELSVRNVPGGGACFTLRLPAA